MGNQFFNPRNGSTFHEGTTMADYFDTTSAYSPPFFERPIIGRSHDVWGAGIVLFQTLAKKKIFPFQLGRDLIFYQKLGTPMAASEAWFDFIDMHLTEKAVFKKPFPKNSTKIIKKLKKLIKGMLHHNWERRMDMREALNKLERIAQLHHKAKPEYFNKFEFPNEGSGYYSE